MRHGCSSAATCARPGRSWSTAFIRGVLEQGVDVVDLGLASTDLVYFAAGSIDAPGAMFTASHNPAQYNGVKFCLSGARAVGQDTGLADIKAVAASVLGGDGPAPAATSGLGDRAATCSDAFVDHVVSFVDADVDAARCGSSPTPPTGWAASSCRPCSSACRRSRSR